jgi:hypothetical protein
MRVGDLQQIMLQTDTVGKVQQQGSHGAEVEQSKLTAQQLIETRDKEKQIQSMEEADTVFIKDRESRQEPQAESDNEERAADSETSDESQFESGSFSGRSGKHIDIRA